MEGSDQDPRFPLQGRGDNSRLRFATTLCVGLTSECQHGSGKYELVHKSGLVPVSTLTRGLISTISLPLVPSKDQTIYSLLCLFMGRFVLGNP